MPALPTRSASQSNLARWQARLATAQAAYRQREAEAQQLYPGSEQKRRQYCEQQQRECARYAAFVAQALTHQEPAPVASEPAPQPAPVPRSWWARLRQRWAGGLWLALLATSAPVGAQQAPQLHVWPQPLDVFTPAYLPLPRVGAGSGPWHVRITPAGSGRAVLDRRLPATAAGVSFSILGYAPGAYLVDVARTGQRWTTRLIVPTPPR